MICFWMLLSQGQSGWCTTCTRVSRLCRTHCYSTSGKPLNTKVWCSESFRKWSSRWPRRPWSPWWTTPTPAPAKLIDNWHLIPCNQHIKIIYGLIIAPDHNDHHTNDYQWLQMTTHDYLWLSMTTDDYQWLPMTSNDYQWLPCNDYQWLPMTTNDYQKDYQQDQTGLDRSARSTLDFGAKGLKVSRSQGLKVSRSQGLKVSRSQGFKVSKFQGRKVSRSQGLKVSRSEGLKV